MGGVIAAYMLYSVPQVGICGGISITVRKAQKLRDTPFIADIAIIPAGYPPARPFLFIAGVALAYPSLIPHILSNKYPPRGKQLGGNEAALYRFCEERTD